MILNNFNEVRKLTNSIAAQVQPEDSVVQPVAEVSPPKWHLAHTSWFFEKFILEKYFPGPSYNPAFHFLFNSYYQSQGEREQRNMRGLHPRPLLSEVLDYRNYVDTRINELVSIRPDDPELAYLMEIGINHEQQHQELLLTDLKYIWAKSPLYPALLKRHDDMLPNERPPLDWIEIKEDIYETGLSGNIFHYDNESPKHKTYLYDVNVASRPVLISEYLEFIEDGGYTNWENWLDDGWHWVMDNNASAPMYWKKTDGEWYIYTLRGLQKINNNEPVSHVNFYEADAYARWKGMRLPTEYEWEVAALLACPPDRIENMLENNNFHPMPVIGQDHAFFGQVWEWTNSAYLPYPNYKPWAGAIGEYNGKFMINQMVLRGGSCITPRDHIRVSYRNFFHPSAQWQFSGIRLAKSQ